MTQDTLESIKEDMISQITSNHLKLLSEISLDDGQLENIREKAPQLIVAVLAGRLRNDILVAYIMMDVGMRNYHDGTYWEDFWNEIDIDHSVNDQTILGRFFIKTMEKYGLAVYDTTNRVYVNNIMMHAFIPENEGYRDAFFNFVLKFYNVVLNGSIPDDLDDKLQKMADVFSDESRDDYQRQINIPLIVSTKHALSDVSYFGRTVTKILRRFAEDYDSLDEVYLGRYEKSFREWVNNIHHRKSRTRGLNEKPFIQFNNESGEIYIIIPSREVSRSGQIPIEIWCSGKSVKKDYLYASVEFDKSVTEEKSLLMSWNPLEPYSIRIDGIVVDEITQNDLIILNKNGNQRRKVSLGFNMVMVRNGSELNLPHTTVYETNDFSIEGFIINRGETLEIGDCCFTVEEELSAGIHIVSPCLDVGCVDQDGNKFNVYSKHPEMRIDIKQSKKFKLTITHGFYELRFESIDQLKSMSKTVSEGIILNLSEVIGSNQNGIFRIRFNGKDLYRYVLMTGFYYSFEEPLYEEDKSSLVFYPGKEQGQAFRTEDGVVRLDPILMDGHEFTLSIQVPSRRFSFDKKTWHMFGETIYFREASASELYIYCPTLVYPSLTVNYENSKPIDLEIEGQYLKCSFSKISMISAIVENSKRNIYKLEFRCGGYDLFIIRYSADYGLKNGVISRFNCPPNTYGVCIEDGTGVEHRFETSLDLPKNADSCTIYEYYDDGFGKQRCRVRQIQYFDTFVVPSAKINIIRAGDDFISVTDLKCGLKFYYKDFRNIIDLDIEYDPVKQEQVDESYRSKGELFFGRYNMVKKEIVRVLISDPNYIRKKKRARRFMNYLPELSYELCKSIPETEKDKEIESWMGILENKVVNHPDEDMDDDSIL